MITENIQETPENVRQFNMPQSRTVSKPVNLAEIMKKRCPDCNGLMVDDECPDCNKVVTL